MNDSRELDPLQSGKYEPLSPEVIALFEKTNAPPRLKAHLILVHDVAFRLIEKLGLSFPGLRIDKDAVLFGAATHDLGKVIYPEELSKPGKQHEARGVDLLEDLGVSGERARFAYTHGNCNGSGLIRMEDLLVALSDHCWKGKRSTDLEDAIVAKLASDTGRESWECYAMLDEIVQTLAADADTRLAWHGSFPVS
jgi:hypothetical protein